MSDNWVGGVYVLLYDMCECRLWLLYLLCSRSHALFNCYSMPLIISAVLFCFVAVISLDFSTFKWSNDPYTPDLIHNPTMHQTHTPQCTRPPSHNVPFCNRYVHMYIFLLQNGPSWDICLMYCRICETGPAFQHLPLLSATFKLILLIDGWGISCEIALVWLVLDRSESTLPHVMTWCRQATSHCLSQC